MILVSPILISYIQLKDRSKDIIISGGENISSIEIEDTLYKHPAVLEAAVVARPDNKWGETPCAFVTLKPSADHVDEQTLIGFCRNNMAHYKSPKDNYFWKPTKNLNRQGTEIQTPGTGEYPGKSLVHFLRITRNPAIAGFRFFICT